MSQAVLAPSESFVIWFGKNPSAVAVVVDGVVVVVGGVVVAIAVAIWGKPTNKY